MINDDPVARLNKVRAEIEKINQQKMRLAGGIDGHKKRLAELETKCQSKFGVSINELSGLLSGLQEDAEKALKDAEQILHPNGKS